MADNPYAPPQAAVSEVIEPMLAVRPKEVTRAVWLLWSGVIVSDLWRVSYLLLKGSAGDVASPLIVVASMPLGLLVVWWFNGKILRGRNWARILNLVGFAFTPLFALQILLSPLYASARMRLLVPLLLTFPLYAWAVWLLFTSPGKEWFRSRR